MATTFCKSQAKVALQDQGNQNILNKKAGKSGKNTPSSTGSRVIPKDGYKFVIGSTAEFQAIFTDTDKPIQVDTGTAPQAHVYIDGRLSYTIDGDLTAGQLYEYSFFWEIPQGMHPRAVFMVEYRGTLGGTEYVWGQEFFQLNVSPQNIKLKQPAYATVDQLRLTKPNIDSYLPIELKNDKSARDYILQEHLATSSMELNGQLNLRDFHSVFNDNFNLYVRYHAVWSIIGSQMGEDGSAVGEKTLNFWEKKWKAVLKQIKMHSQLSNIPTGRA
jgi:hypothetical protein